MLLATTWAVSKKLLRRAIPRSMVSSERNNSISRVPNAPLAGKSTSLSRYSRHGHRRAPSLGHSLVYTPSTRLLSFEGRKPAIVGFAGRFKEQQ